MYIDFRDTTATVEIERCVLDTTIIFRSKDKKHQDRITLVTEIFERLVKEINKNE